MNLSFPEPNPTHTPPANLEAEQMLLGGLLMDSSALASMAFLNPEQFSEPLHQRIFEGVRDLHAQGVAGDVVTLRRRFEQDEELKSLGGMAYLAKLVGMATVVFNLGDYAKEIYHVANMRKLQALCQDAMDKIQSGTLAAEEIAHAVHAGASAVMGEQETMQVHSAREVTLSILEDLRTARPVQSTGMKHLDKAMGGGLYAGRSYGFAARKKVGKTMLAGTISYNLAQSGVKHLFICGEMGEREIHTRLLSRHMREYPSHFRTHAKDHAFQERVARAANEFKNSILYQDAPGLSLDDLKRFVVGAHHKHNIQGFILDYWQLVGGKAKAKSQVEHQDEVAQWIANTCRKLGIWSITMGQINQDGNTRGGEGMRLAFDQVYQIDREDVTQPVAWMEMMDTRYTAWMNIGSADMPGYDIEGFGPYFQERT